MKLLHVVRRYGPVGGMERYVWEITRELRDLGHQVEVLCEVCLAEKQSGIVVYQLGAITARPGWLALLRFGSKVQSWLKANPHHDWLIHSHERVSCHDITTFHGSSFVTIFEKPWWQRISLRVAMQLFLEQRELSVATQIVPNSQITKQQLVSFYPEFIHKITNSVAPGAANGLQREPREVPNDSGVIGFVGKEWQRKGLTLAVAAVRQLRRARPNLKFIVIGPNVDDVQHLFVDWQGGYELMGWIDRVPYSDFDVLLHPAKTEPYGMVISEAMAARVPVVISNKCGAAADLPPGAGAVLPMPATLEMWIGALEQQLSRSRSMPGFVRGWREAAQEYEIIYQRHSSCSSLSLLKESLGTVN